MTHHESTLEGMLPHEMIAIRAHQLWAARGCPAGEAERDWFDARRELERELTVRTESTTATKRAA